MRRKKKYTDDDSPSEGAPEWMTTYSDLVTLLLTFFILLFSMAAIDQQKFDAVAKSLRLAFGDNSGALYAENIGNNFINMPNLIDNKNNNAELDEEDYNFEYQMKLKNFREEVEGAITQHSLQDQINLIDESTKLVLRLNEVLLFDTGKADLNKNHIDVINKIGTMLNTLGTEIIVEGHTDNVPINTYTFPSNWELSTKRAVNLVKYFIDYCDMDEKNLVPQGRGEFHPIADNATEAGRKQNRRIDIIVDKYISTE